MNTQQFAAQVRRRRFNQSLKKDPGSREGAKPRRPQLRFLVTIS
jgi:hypothetical protein